MSVKTSTDKVKYTLSQASFYISEQGYNTFTGGNREGAIPDPIPNSEVKPFIADGTAHKSVGE